MSSYTPQVRRRCTTRERSLNAILEGRVAKWVRQPLVFLLRIDQQRLEGLLSVSNPFRRFGFLGFRIAVLVPPSVEAGGGTETLLPGEIRHG